ncbi:MAG: PAS domain-containing protein [Candidatus Lindowbacteria bacterium]|nr:PAS domain-containing protein [Candidatus Lindowbacteria bacterium]
MAKKEWEQWLHHQLFEQVPCCIAVSDRNLNIVEHNRKFEEVFGQGRGSKCHEVYKGMPRRCGDCMAIQTFADGKSRVNDEVGVDHKGHKTHYLVHFLPITAPDGSIPYVAELSIDVTETKRLQKEYQILFDRVPCFVMVLNRDYRVVRANERVREVFGDCLGRRCYEVLKRRLEKCDDCPAEQTFSDGHCHGSTHVGTDKHGNDTYYTVNSSPLLSGNGHITHVIDMALDLTETRRLEEEVSKDLALVKKLELEKLEAERFAAVGETVAGLAHGIKNIVMGLEGAMYVFNAGMKKGEQARIDQGWEMLNRNIGKISALVKNLLAFSKGRVLSARMTDPKELVRDVVTLFHDLSIRQNIELVGEVNEAVAPAPLDPDGIHECLINLVSNAVDACKTSDKPRCRVIVRVREENNSLVFEVEDSGCGMDYETKQRVFTTFFTTKGTGGTGMGLLITRRITQEHGGRISMESTPGKGSLFRLIFPRDRLPTLTTTLAPA